MTFSEENYLKTIYHLTIISDAEVSTNAIAEMMETKASSVTDMLKKLADKDLVNYIKYQGVSLTNKGKLTAKMIVRKHRLWEVFLVEKLDFSWDEVHDIAEQLEHIKSEKLIHRSDYSYFHSITTRWADNDIYGHMNNIIYYALFDTAVNKWLIKNNLIDIKNGKNIGLIVQSGCNYFSSFQYPEDIDAGIRVTKIGTSSLIISSVIAKLGNRQKIRRIIFS